MLSELFYVISYSNEASSILIASDSDDEVEIDEDQTGPTPPIDKHLMKKLVLT